MIYLEMGKEVIIRGVNSFPDLMVKEASEFIYKKIKK